MEQKTIKGSSISKTELTPYNVGLMRLKEANICKSRFSTSEIEHIGRCSIKRQKVVLGRIGNEWAIGGYISNRFVPAPYQRFKAHYVIVGKQVTSLHPAHNMTAEKSLEWFEARDISKPVHEMTAQDMFEAGKGVKPCRRRAPKASANEQAKYHKTFDRITPTCKDSVRVRTSMERIQQYHNTFKKSFYEA